MSGIHPNDRVSLSGLQAPIHGQSAHGEVR